MRLHSRFECSFLFIKTAWKSLCLQDHILHWQRGKTIALILKGKATETSMAKIRWAGEKSSTINLRLHPKAFCRLFQLNQQRSSTVGEGTLITEGFVLPQMPAHRAGAGPPPPGLPTPAGCSDSRSIFGGCRFTSSFPAFCKHTGIWGPSRS